MSLKVHVYKCLFKFSFCRTCGFHDIFIFVGTLDRYEDGDRAQIILENTISVTKPLSTSSSSPVQVHCTCIHVFVIMFVCLSVPVYNRIRKQNVYVHVHIQYMYM